MNICFIWHFGGQSYNFAQVLHKKKPFGPPSGQKKVQRWTKKKKTYLELWPTLADSVWLWLTLANSGWLMMTLADYVWPWLTLAESGWLLLTLADSGLLKLTLANSDRLWLTLADYGWPWLTLADSGWLWMTLTDSVGQPESARVIKSHPESVRVSQNQSESARVSKSFRKFLVSYWLFGAPGGPLKIFLCGKLLQNWYSGRKIVKWNIFSFYGNISEPVTKVTQTITKYDQF